MKKEMICAIAGFAVATLVAGEAIPLPEHPRPDWQRAEWQNLNGSWRFAADKADVGVKEKWFEAADTVFPQRILVPFGWGSPASGVKDEADIGWYRRDITVPAAWKGKRVFLVVGGEPLVLHAGVRLVGREAPAAVQVLPLGALPVGPRMLGKRNLLRSRCARGGQNRQRANNCSHFHRVLHFV